MLEALPTEILDHIVDYIHPDSLPKLGIIKVLYGPVIRRFARLQTEGTVHIYLDPTKQNSDAYHHDVEEALRLQIGEIHRRRLMILWVHAHPYRREAQSRLPIPETKAEDGHYVDPLTGRTLTLRRLTWTIGAMQVRGQKVAANRHWRMVVTEISLPSMGWGILVGMQVYTLTTSTFVNVLQMCNTMLGLACIIVNCSRHRMHGMLWLCLTMGCGVGYVLGGLLRRAVLVVMR